jgi:hypothetical protein
MQQRIASIVGVTKDWIPFLREGVNQFEEQKKKASDLGIIIDDATIAKAKEFEKQWHTAVAGWDLQFKASMASILPLLTQLANVATSIINGVGSLSTDVSRMFTPHESMNTRQLKAEMDTVAKLRDKLAAGETGMGIGLIERLVGLEPGASVADVDKLLDKITGLYNKPRVNIRAAMLCLVQLNRWKSVLPLSRRIRRRSD